MQNLLETYDESSNSSHISVESDRQPICVDVDESSAAEVQPVAKKKAQKTFQPQVQISKFFAPVQKQASNRSEQSSNSQKITSDKEGRTSQWTDWKIQQKKQKDAERKRNLEQRKAAPTQKLETKSCDVHDFYRM